MTYIEFFDNAASENISACLTFIPDRVIYIGNNTKLINKHITNYSRVFQDRGYNIEFIPKSVSRNNLEQVVKVLSEIVEKYDDCVFDITGGEEILTLALGIVYCRYPKKNIQIHKFNLRNNAVYDCDKDGTTIFHETPALTVEENIRIYGGDIVYGGIDEENTYKWDMNSTFLEDVNRIWEICRGNVRYWNRQIGVFEAIAQVGMFSEDGLAVSASRNDVEQYLVQRNATYKKAKGIIGNLLKHKLITYFSDEDNTTITVAFKNKQVKKILTKAGLALEMKVYSAAMGLREQDGRPVYNDIMNGVVIDWDGEFHDEESENVYDTENEVDILMMHDIVPVFISCKNGIVTSEELYKLETVAKRFGGEYSKKVLVSTAIDTLGEAGKYLRQRAVDMNIKLLANIQEYDDAKLADELKNLWNT